MASGTWHRKAIKNFDEPLETRPSWLLLLFPWFSRRLLEGEEAAYCSTMHAPQCYLGEVSCGQGANIYEALGRCRLIARFYTRADESLTHLLQVEDVSFPEGS